MITKNLMLKEKKIGRAEVEPEGLFYVIKCFYDQVPDCSYTLFMQEGDVIERLGLCIPERKGPCLVTRIEKRKCNIGVSRFWLGNSGAKADNSSIALVWGKPLACINELEFTRFQKEENGCKLVISNI